MEMYIVSKEGIEKFLCEAINVRTPDGKSVHTGILNLANSWLSIDNEISEDLKEIRKLAHNAYKSKYVDKDRSLDAIDGIAKNILHKQESYV